MVATKSKKTAKYTYTERVLGAFTQVQKDHRKHAVHLASLRAQVRKTAQAKKDKLGPQWSNWVGKAVHKLEEEGVLVASEPLGSVTLTPNGRKAIQAARRNLAISPHASPSSAEDDIIWKQVVHQFSGHGLKRKQTVDENADEESDEEREVLSTSKKRNTRSKRPRTSPVKKPISKMTKAELKEELKALQRAHAEAFSTPQHTEEARQLSEKLKSRQDEINTIRNELVQAKRLDLVDEAQHDGDVSSRLTTPESVTDFASSPIRPHLPNVLVRSGPSLGLIRTQSGSLIPDISKQPTPAPSSPDAEGSPLFGADETVFGVVIHNDADTLNPLATPTTTPTRLSATANQTELAKELERYRCQVEELRKTGEEYEKISQSRVESLDLALSARSLELQSLQKTIMQLQSEHTEIEQSLSGRNREVVDLQTEIEVFKRKQAENTAAITIKDTRISELEVASAKIQDTLAFKNDRLAELESVLQEHLSSLGLGAEKENYVIQMSSLGRVLHDATDAREFAAVEVANARMASLSKELKAQLDAERSVNAAQLEKLRIAETDKASLSGQIAATAGRQAQAEVALEEARESVRALGAQLIGSDEVLGETRAANTELKKKLAQSGQDVENLRAQVISLQTSIETINSQVVSSTSTVEALKAELANAAEHVSGLASELEVKERNTVELIAGKAKAQSDAASFAAQLQVANGAVAAFESEKDALDKDLGKARTELNRLVLECTTKERQRKELAEKVSLTETLRDRLVGDLNDKKKEIQDLRLLLDLAEGKKRNLEANLETAQAGWKVSANDYDSTINTLRNTLLCTQSEVDRFGSRVDALVAEVAATQSQLDKTHSQCRLAQGSVEAERQHARALEKKWTEAATRAEEAEEELAELKSSKEADAVTIESLKDVFARLQKAQMSSLAELENEVVSAQSSPVPKSRRTARA